MLINCVGKVFIRREEVIMRRRRTSRVRPGGSRWVKSSGAAACHYLRWTTDPPRGKTFPPQVMTVIKMDSNTGRRAAEVCVFALRLTHPPLFFFFSSHQSQTHLFLCQPPPQSSEIFATTKTFSAGYVATECSAKNVKRPKLAGEYVAEMITYN